MAIDEPGRPGVRERDRERDPEPDGEHEKGFGGREGREIDDDPQARAEWFLSSRSGLDGSKLQGAILKASRARHRMVDAAAAGTEPGTPGPAGSVNWTPIGPSVIASGWIESGRVTSLVIGPGGSRVYLGSANGGVWLSSDGGAGWSPLDDYVVSPSLFGGAAAADSLAVGALAVRFGASAIADEVYVGTGEPNGNYDAYFGIGIRHLVAGSWSLEATNLASRGIYAIVIDPDDPTRVLAATTAGIFRRPTSGSMTSWTQVTSPTFANGNAAASGLIVAGTGAAKSWYAAFYGDKVYRSTDTTTWTGLTGLSGAGRIALAAGESDPTAVYALRADGTLNRLSGTAFSVVTGMPGSVLFADPPTGQGWYDIVVAVDPSNANTVYLGGDAYSLFKGTLTGSAGSWVFPFNAANAANPTVDPTWVGQGIHSDVHAFAFALTAAGTAHDATVVWVGSDGGGYRSTASGAAGTFQPRNTGLAITQFASVAQRADTDAVVFAGAQDNGTPRLLGEQAARDTAGGDGGGVAYDPTDPYRVLRQYVRAALDVTRNGGATWSSVAFPPTTAVTTAQQTAAGTENSSTGFVAPIASGPGGEAAFGTNRLWLTKDWGTTWMTLPTATNPYVPATPDLAQDAIGGGSVRAIAFASSSRIFAATASTIWQYDTTTAWASATKTNIATTGLPAGFFITDIAVENASSGTFYVTLGGGGHGHVYYWDGTAWAAAMPATVVDVPAHAVIVDPAASTTLYAGTDVGVFRGVKAGAAWSWSLFSAGLPESAVTDLAIHAGARLLRAATHGRGVWEIDLAATTAMDPDLYLRVNYNDTGRLSAGNRNAWVEGRQDPTHADATNPYVLYHWMSADIKVRRSSLSGLPSLGSPVDYLDFAANIGDYVDSVQHIETADVSGTDRIFVEVHNRGLNPLPASQVRVLLLVTDASAGLPALPAGYATQINAGNTSPSWLGSSWRFVEAASPYRTLVRDLDVRTPQVVEYTLDFGSLGLSAGHDHVCLAAFVTAPADPLTATTTSLDQLTMTDKHVAHRNTHLVALGTRPATEPADQPGPMTSLLIDFHNATPKAIEADLVFDRTHFPGPVSIMLPSSERLGAKAQPMGFDVTSTGEGVQGGIRALIASLGEALEEIGEWLERAAGEQDDDEPDDERGPGRTRRLRRLRSLDRKQIYRAERGSLTPSVERVAIEPGAAIAAAVMVHAPLDARPGDRYRLDVLQKLDGRIMGGSTYILVVPDPPRR
jgi:hypothetical protein